MQIPEDLKQRYEHLGNYQPLEVAVTDIYVREWQLLIERIATAEQTIAELRAEVERLIWKPITPESLPKLGDEVYGHDGKTGYPESVDIEDDYTAEEWVCDGYTHYRPSNYPASTKGEDNEE